MSKVANMLNMLQKLKDGQVHGIKELAQKLEVSERMIRQYKLELEQVGIYIKSTTGKYGGYQLEADNNFLQIVEEQKEEKTTLVTSGIYSISRNPAFLGFDLMYIGILFTFFNVYLCFATAFALVFFHLQIVNVEEDFLVEAFGNEYIAYRKKVCRYIGRKFWN